jgi:hypothetical protein
MTEEGYPRTEFVWRHPPVFEDAIGRTQPVIINAGLGDPNAGPEQFLEDGLQEAETARSPKDEESLLFRDSGHGWQGMLPGLLSLAPTANGRYKNVGAVVGDLGERVNFWKVVGDEEMGKVKIAGNAEGEATKALKRMQEKRMSRSAGSREGTASQPHVGDLLYVGDLVKGVNGLQV